jgi:shikimate kinase
MPREIRNIFLTGYRATGKSSVGKAISAKLGRKFVDTDYLVEQKCGIPISEIVAKKGWEFFRTNETSVIKDVVARKNQVVALGGGAVCHEFSELREENRRMIKENGLVILLTANPEIIHKRMLEDEATTGRRPALTDKNPRQEITDKLAEREQSYRSIANVVIDTSNMELKDVIEKVLSEIKSA